MQNIYQDFPFFFITSFLSDIIIKIISFQIITIVMVVLNTGVFYFLYNFEFLERGEDLGENYSTFNFFKLILFIIYFNLILGIVALLPMNIFSAGYYYYEQNLMKKIIKSKGEINPSYINDDIDSLINNDDNEDIIINDKNNEIKEKKIKVNNISITQFSSENDNNGTKKENVSNKFIRDSSSFFIEINNFPKEKIKEPNNKGKVMGRYNGYYISYIIAFLIAIIVRIFQTRKI